MHGGQANYALFGRLMSLCSSMFGSPIYGLPLTVAAVDYRKLVQLTNSITSPLYLQARAMATFGHTGVLPNLGMYRQCKPCGRHHSTPFKIVWDRTVWEWESGTYTRQP